MQLEQRNRPPKHSETELYEPEFVTSLFDEMSATYGITNYISSFGFCQRWRQQTIDGVKLRTGMLVIDLMTGTGECWGPIARQMDGVGQIIGIDLSTEMIRRADSARRHFENLTIEVRQCDALDSGMDDAMADCVVACFGLKTLSQSQVTRLCAEVWRMLKPGGTFSFVEITVPRGWFLRIPYLLYLRYVIPLLGRILLGNPANYRMLAVYAEHFSKGDTAVACLEQEGFIVKVDDLFFGCARRISGEKPQGDSRITRARRPTWPRG